MAQTAKMRLARATRRRDILIDQGKEFNPAGVSESARSRAVGNITRAGVTGTAVSGAIQGGAHGTASAPKGGTPRFRRPGDSGGGLYR